MAAADRSEPQAVPRLGEGGELAAAPPKRSGASVPGALSDASDPPTRAAGEAPRLLLVEDSADDAELTLHALAKSGLASDAKWVRDGAEAMEWLAAEGAQSVKLILLDLKMPRMDGYDVLRALRILPGADDIAVLVMVSAPDAPEIERCLALGAKGYLVKPLTAEALREAARKAEVPLGRD